MMAEKFSESDRALFERLSRRPSPVARERPSWGFTVGLGAIAVGGLILFVSLDAARTAQPAVVTSDVVRPAQPVVLAASAVQPVPAAVIPVTSAASDDAADEQSQRLHAPAMIVDLSQGGSTSGGPVAVAAAPQASAADLKASADERFAARVADGTVDVAQASHIGDTKLMIPQGTTIPAVLETGINSDVPGFVRAVVSRDVRGFDGTTVLVPRGSKLIGQYRSGVAVGQSRAFIVWSRLLTPEGVSIDIGSPAIDAQGQGGVAGETNSHFLKRFGAAILMSVLNAGLSAGVNAVNPSHTSIQIGSPQQATNVAGQALQRDLDTPTTITVPAGTPIRAFVARDLDFSAVASAR
jgi:type IV secretory pathway VirB10-like protein